MDSKENNEKCLACNRSSDEVPLLVLWHKGQNYWICPQHLPVLIHQPQKLGDKFPGVTFGPTEGH